MRYLSLLLIYLGLTHMVAAQIIDEDHSYCAVEDQYIVNNNLLNPNSQSAVYGQDFTPKGDLRALAIFVDFEGTNDEDHDLPGWPAGNLPNFLNNGSIPFAHEEFSEFSPLGSPVDNARRNVSEFFYHMSNGEFRFYIEPLRDDNGENVLLTIDALGASSYEELRIRTFEELNNQFPNRDWGALGFDTRPDAPNFNYDASSTFDSPLPNNKIDYIIIYFRNRSGWDNHPSGSDNFPGATANDNIGDNPKQLSNGYVTEKGFTFRQSFTSATSNVDIILHEMSHGYLRRRHTGFANATLGSYLYGNGDWGMMEYGHVTSVAAAWERWYSGWIDIKHDLTGENSSDNGVFQLGDYMQTGDAMRLQLPNIENQYLWLTFRSDTDNTFYKRIIPDSWITSDPNLEVPITNEGLFGLFTRQGSSLEDVNSPRVNGTKIMHGRGYHDYLIDETGTQNRPDLFVTRKKANPYGQQGESSSFRNDFNSDNTISSTEYGFIEEVNSTSVFGRHAIRSALSDGKYSAFTNPPIDNFLQYSTSQNMLSPVILHGLSFTSARIGDQMQISVDYDDGHIESDFRMTGNVLIPKEENIVLNTGIKLTVNRSKSTNRRSLVNGQYINETVFIAAEDGGFTMDDSSIMLLDEGSTTIFKAGSRLTMEENTQIIVRNGALLCLETENLWLSSSAKIILDGGSISVSSNTDISSNIENATPEINISPTLLDNFIFCDPHPDQVNVHSRYGTFTGNASCGSDVLVTEIQAVRLTSQEFIEIEPGFEVEPGGFFEANIHSIANDCNIEFFFGLDGVPNGFADNLPPPADKSNAKSAGELSVVIYPNPTASIINIEINDARGPFTYEVKNFDNRVLLKGDASSERFSVNTTSLKKGTYVLSISNKTKVVQRRIIKM